MQKRNLLIDSSRVPKTQETNHRRSHRLAQLAPEKMEAALLSVGSLTALQRANVLFYLTQVHRLGATCRGLELARQKKDPAMVAVLEAALQAAADGEALSLEME